MLTDSIAIILSIFFFAQGASRGFINSLMVPFSIIVASALSIIYYKITGDMMASLLIAVIGPLLLSLLLRFLIKMWARATNNDVVSPTFLSRWGGAILTLIWGWVFITFTLILLSVLPPWNTTLEAVHKDVTKSISYSAIKPLTNIIFGTSKENVAASTSNAPSADAASLAQDPRFQKVLQDPDVQKEINAHDFVNLMKNPKMLELVQQIMSDPDTMKKVMAVYRTQTQPQAVKTP